MSEIEARREARRRRVLENSDKRLQKITGVQNRNDVFELDGYKSSLNVDDTWEENGLHKRPSLNETINTDQFPRQHTPFISAPSVDTNTNLTSSNIHCFKTHRARIVILLAFFCNIVLGFLEKYDYQFVKNIFVPLLCFETVDLIFNKQQANDDLLKFLTLFKNISHHQLVRISKYLSIIKTISKDVMVYFFVFVCITFFRNITDVFLQ